MKSLDSSTHVRFANILFATDLSPTAEKALPYAVEIGRRYHSTIYAVHVIQPDFYPLVPPDAWPQMAEKEAGFRQESQRRLDEQLGDVRHEIIFKTGETWPTLAEVIHKKEIDLIVLSTHGRSGFERVLMGSVAEQVFRQALCPVLTVGPSATAKSKNQADLIRILYATDFSLESLVGAHYAISLAREHRAQLILLHCLKSGGDIPTLLHTLRDVVPSGSDLRCAPDCIVERGVPADKILEVSEGHGADMIVLGIHGANGHFARSTHFARSGAYRIVTEAKCPVLTVRS